MFGLTKREQRWKAEQKAAETIAGVLVAAINAKSHKGVEMNKAEELIACLEGEIAKRDARIVELERRCGVYGLELHNATERLQQAERQIKAIKAQEPVAYIPVDRETGEEWHPVLKKGSGNICDYKPLYAAPVSEAKAQGVVMPDRAAFEAWMLRFEHPVLGWLERESFTFGDDQSTYADEYIQGAWVACSRLYAAPVQQVSVPDVSAMARILADRNADACNVNREDNWTIYGQDYIDDVTAMLAAAPAAPAADAL